MTSTTDKAGHPDVDELSDLSEDLLPPSRTEEVQGHLEGCASCAEIYASLTEIRALLGTLSGPTHMPEDVAARIDAALLDVSRETDSVADVSRETSATPWPAQGPAPTPPPPRPTQGCAPPPRPPP
ncbi:anti-sigma factor family protein, partial [Streptomyces griseoaurantiacus]|uniref:anti-sigma factor family protein n=1 Tax=Streptomyces griseoaurantiacus TaxID=68213 RepID=UPI00366444AF